MEGNNMDKQTIFAAWGPSQSVWSKWAKPVLFAHLPRRLSPPSTLPVPDVSWAPATGERWAIVLDLWGVESVSVGLALAAVGYRPVPLFNACSLPTSLIETQQMGPEQIRGLMAVDVDAILSALVQGSDRLSKLSIAPNAPPVFLLDEQRQDLSQPLREGLFDNRSVVFMTDFPSATFLSTQGIQGVIVVRDHDLKSHSDLAYVLRTWQAAGIRLSYKLLADAATPQPLKLSSSFWVKVWLWLLAVWSKFRFYRQPTGSFGGFVPESSSG